ncbi:Zinc knuckle CX2CX4HX4C [Sesbania bispinosa]|nr:Zinc knuckle CX2CX4HX4C [Sesbania bispinosa]
MDIAELDFSRVPVRVQLWGLPAHCKTSKMGFRIGSSIGNVKASDVFESKERGSFVKILVDIDVEQPLKAGVNVGSKKDGIYWVDFQYEKLPQFCYACGMLGHNKDFCSNKEVDKPDDETENGSLGPWMRASVFGRKIVNMSTPMASHSHDWRTPKRIPIPSTELSKLLSSLTVDPSPKNNDPDCLESVIVPGQPNTTRSFEDMLQNVSGELTHIENTIRGVFLPHQRIVSERKN